MKLSPQEKNKIIHIVSMVTIFILVVLILCLPKLRANNRCNRQILKLSKELERLIQISQNPAGFEKEKVQILNDLKASHEKIPLQAMIPQAISQITGPAKELGISIIEIKPQSGIRHDRGEEPAESYMGTPIELSIQCTYKQLGIYLDRLRHLPRLAVLDELNITKKEEILPELKVKLKISVFHLG